MAAGAPGGASATVTNLGTLPVGDFTPTGNITTSGAFAGEWDFKVSLLAAVASTVFNYNFPAKQNIIGLHLSLFDTTTSALLASSGTGTGAKGEFESIPTTTLKATDSYAFVVTGFVPVGDKGVYDLNIDVASAVPEWSAWAMTLIGFGLVGVQLRRKTRPASASA
jgi:hypothetical protein